MIAKITLWITYKIYMNILMISYVKRKWTLSQIINTYI